MKTTRLSLLICFAAGLLRAADAPVIPPPLEQPPDRPGLQIHADMMSAHLTSNIVHYSDNVVLIDPPAKPGDPETRLTCRELWGWAGESNKLDRVVARGDVLITRGDMMAAGEQAVFTATNERIVLTGGYRKPDELRKQLPEGLRADARLNGFLRTNTLPIAFSAKIVTAGEQIVYDRRAESFSAIRGAFTYVPPDTLKATQTNSTGGTLRSTNRTRSPFSTSPRLRGN